MFGTITGTRCAWRGKGQTSVHPAGAELSLPAHLHSQGLRHLAVLEAARGFYDYDQAEEAIDRSCGKVLGTRQAGQLVVAAAADSGAFCQHKIPLPPASTTAPVLQADGQGIVMRPEALRPATLKTQPKSQCALRTRLAPGEKPHRKRMATLACVFDAGPSPRRPHDVIAPPRGRSLLRSPRPGPKAHHKWLTASLVHPPEHVIAVAFDQAQTRGRDHLRDWVVLVGGARHQLALIQAGTGRRHITVHVLLAFVHVAEYVRGMIDSDATQPPALRRGRVPEALARAERQVFTRPVPKSAKAQREFLYTRAKQSTKALAERLGVSTRTGERSRAERLTTPRAQHHHGDLTHLRQRDPPPTAAVVDRRRADSVTTVLSHRRRTAGRSSWE